MLKLETGYLPGDKDPSIIGKSVRALSLTFLEDTTSGVADGDSSSYVPLRRLFLLNVLSSAKEAGCFIVIVQTISP